MSTSELSSVFPLPLTPFEELMFRDGTEDFPMQFYLQVQLKGVVDKDVMRVAAADAFRRHPLLNARVTEIRGRLHWVWAGENFPEADWNADQWRREQPWKQTIDLRRQTGLRAWAEQKGDAAELTLQYHHACCDGIGAAQFLQDLAVCYAREFGRRRGDAELPELEPLDASLLKTRNAEEGRRIAKLSGNLLRRIQVTLKYTLRYLREKKVPVISCRATEKKNQFGLGIRQVELDRQQTRRIRDTARNSNGTVNDVLVSELIQFADSWNEKARGRRRRKLTLRQPTGCVLVPTSLRGPNDSQMPACNIVSYIFMSRPLTMTRNPRALLGSIRDDMKLVSQFQAGWMFIQALSFLKRIPGGLKMMMYATSGSCMSTTVLSHMGNLFNAIGRRLPRDDDGFIRMGDLIVENIYGVPPLRQGTSVVFSSMMVGGRLKLCVRCCDQTFSEQEARELVEHLRQQLGRICNDPVSAAANQKQAAV